MIEGAEVHVHADAPVAGLAEKRLDVVAVEVAKVGTVEQPGDVAVQMIQPLLLLRGAEAHQHRVVGVRIERVVFVLQLDLLAVEAQVMQPLNQLGQLAHRLTVAFRQFAVATEQLDQLGGLERNELRRIFG